MSFVECCLQFSFTVLSMTICNVKIFLKRKKFIFNNTFLFSSLLSPAHSLSLSLVHLFLSHFLLIPKAPSHKAEKSKVIVVTKLDLALPLKPHMPDVAVGASINGQPASEWFFAFIPHLTALQAATSHRVNHSWTQASLPRTVGWVLDLGVFGSFGLCCRNVGFFCESGCPISSGRRLFLAA